jgi:hypothetical protein
MIFLEFFCRILHMFSERVLIRGIPHTNRSGVLQYDRRASRVLRHEARHIVRFGVEHYPARLLGVVLCDFRSINVTHCSEHFWM